MYFYKSRSVFICLLVAVAFSWDPLVATNPSPEARELFNRLASYNRNAILSGQTSFHYDDLKNLVEQSPLVQAFDMQNYSPHNPWFNWSPVDDGTVANAIAWYKSTNKKGIVSFHWHWFSPMGGQLRTSTFYTNYTDFDVTKAVIVGTPEYDATVRDIKTIAVQLQRLKQQNIPILWRPLHEAGGQWFWWGAKTATATKKLLNMIFQILDVQYEMNNLIWVWSTPEKDWYPGKDRVDIIGYDSYPGAFKYDCNINMFMQLHGIVNGTKMIALSQNGPIPNIDQCFSSGAMWSYFLSWSDLVFQQNDEKHLKAVYADPRVKTVERP